MNSERSRLIGIAYRMLGSYSDAEDAASEALLRWYRLTDAERDAIDVPRAWLTRVVGRICLDLLGSARVRREHYVGQWLPEPVRALATGDDGTSDPADRVALHESVGLALLVVLDSLSPAERVAFVLHDAFAVPFDDIANVLDRTPAACRQLASAARRRVHDDPAAPALPTPTTASSALSWLPPPAEISMRSSHCSPPTSPSSVTAADGCRRPATRFAGPIESPASFGVSPSSPPTSTGRSNRSTA